MKYSPSLKIYVTFLLFVSLSLVVHGNSQINMKATLVHCSHPPGCRSPDSSYYVKDIYNEFSPTFDVRNEGKSVDICLTKLNVMLTISNDGPVSLISLSSLTQPHIILRSVVFPIMAAKVADSHYFTPVAPILVHSESSWLTTCCPFH